jgi:hypothetical protein
MKAIDKKREGKESFRRDVSEVTIHSPLLLLLREVHLTDWFAKRDVAFLEKFFLTSMLR